MRRKKLKPKTRRKYIKIAAHVIGTGVIAAVALFGAIIAHNNNVYFNEHTSATPFFIVLAGVAVIFMFNYLVADYAQHIDRKRRSEGEPGDKTFKPVKM